MTSTDNQPEIRYGIRVTSWRGLSLLAIHYYGKVWVYNENLNPTDHIADALEKNPKEFELSHKLTAEEAEALNEKDGIYSLKAGDETIRFETREAVIATGVRFIRATYGDVPIAIGECWDLEPEMYEDKPSATPNP